MKDLGSLTYFLGIAVTGGRHDMFLSQLKYATKINERAKMSNYKPPTDTTMKFDGTCLPASYLTLYHNLTVALQYLAFTRLNIYYVVQQVCLYIHDPREPHFSDIKLIMRYIRITLNNGLQLYASPSRDLIAYSDAELVGCSTTKHSTSGYYVFLGQNFLSWYFKRQSMISCSNIEAEYRGVVNVVAETNWIHNLLHDLLYPSLSKTLVYCYNVSAIYLSTIPIKYQCTKHIEIDIYFVRDKVTLG